MLDDLVQDLFGLSVRAVSSIVTLCRQPKDYYATAWDKNWEGRFTPSIRLWLSLFALLTFLASSLSGVVELVITTLQTGVPLI